MFFSPSRPAMKSFKLWETYPENIQSPENRAFFDAKTKQLYPVGLDISAAREKPFQTSFPTRS